MSEHHESEHHDQVDDMRAPRGRRSALTSTKSPELNPQRLNLLLRSRLRKREDGEVYFSTGRGGAGNMRHGKEVPLPKLGPVGSNTPELHQKVYTTGRGGAGNMVVNDNSNRARAAQDVGEELLLPVTLGKGRVHLPPPAPHAVGRGGFGNVMQATRSRAQELGAIDGSTAGKKEKKGFGDKVRALFK